MTDPVVLREDRGAVAVLTPNRPVRMSGRTPEEKRLPAFPPVAARAVTGTGGYADIRVETGGSGVVVMREGVHAVVRRLAPWDKPTLAMGPDAALKTVLLGETYDAGRARRMLRRGLELTLDRSVGDAELAVMVTNDSADAHEGVAAFRDRQPPVFRGR